MKSGIFLNVLECSQSSGALSIGMSYDDAVSVVFSSVPYSISSFLLVDPPYFLLDTMLYRYNGPSVQRCFFKSKFTHSYNVLNVPIKISDITEFLVRFITFFAFNVPIIVSRYDELSRRCPEVRFKVNALHMVFLAIFSLAPDWLQPQQSYTNDRGSSVAFRKTSWDFVRLRDPCLTDGCEMARYPVSGASVLTS